MLQIPENYYEDLAARTDLSKEEIDELRGLNILYDADQNGTFFQAYTATMDNGFFFEIVQRDRYHGYAALNAGDQADCASARECNHQRIDMKRILPEQT